MDHEDQFCFGGGFWVMCSLPCSSSRTRHQSSCSSSFSSVSQDGCTQTAPEGQRIRRFNEPLSSPQITWCTTPRLSVWAHRWTMACFLKLRDFSGKRTNQIVRSIAVMIRAIHLQKDERSCDCYQANRWFKTGSIQLVEPSAVFQGHWSRTSEEEQWTSSRWDSDCSSPPIQTQTIPIMTWTLSSI